MEQKNNSIQISDFFNYYKANCKSNCLDNESAFTMQFHPWWIFVQQNKNIEHIPIMNSNNKPDWLKEQDILKKVIDYKNANK